MKDNLSLTVHCLVKNEERWVWYALNSVIAYADQIIVFDTGSTDRTVKLIQSINNPKLVFEQKGKADKKRLSELRQEMLDRTKTTWFLILDGDEIWPKDTIEEALNVVRKAPAVKEAVVAGMWMCQGDIFHYSPEVERLCDPKVPKLSGYRSVRFIKKIPGLRVTGEYGNESYIDKKGVNISDWKKNRLIYIRNKYWHMSYLSRSINIKNDRQVLLRAFKQHFAKGVPFPKNIKYPEVFYKARPLIVPDPWRKMTINQQVTGWFYRLRNFIDRISAFHRQRK